MDPIVISLVAGVAVMALIGAVAFVLRDMGSTSVEDRLEVMTGKKSRESKNEGILKDDALSEGLTSIANIFGGMRDRIARLNNLFEQADSPIKADAFFGISAGFAVVGVAIGWLSQAPAPLYPVFALAMGILPLGWLLFRRKKRFKAFAMQLPDAMELIARALRSSYPLTAKN